MRIKPDGHFERPQLDFFQVQKSTELYDTSIWGLCVDTNGWVYLTTSTGLQVCDQAGRVNFVVSVPPCEPDPFHTYSRFYVRNVCFGGKDLSELFIACGDKIYKRPTKAHGYISGQMAPIKPAPPKL